MHASAQGLRSPRSCPNSYYQDGGSRIASADRCRARRNLCSIQTSGGSTVFFLSSRRAERQGLRYQGHKIHRKEAENPAGDGCGCGAAVMWLRGHAYIINTEADRGGRLGKLADGRVYIAPDLASSNRLRAF